MKKLIDEKTTAWAGVVMKRLLCLLAPGVFLAVAPSSRADTVFTDEASFLAVVGSAILESYEDLPVDNQSSQHQVLFLDDFDLSGRDVDLSVNDIPAFGQFATDGANYVRSTNGATLTWAFDSPQLSFATDIIDWGDFGIGTLLFSTDTGAIVQVATAPLPDGHVEFFGFLSDTPFTEVVLSHDREGESWAIDKTYYLPAAAPGECLTILDQEVVCHPDGETFTVNVEGINACTGGITQATFTSSGGAVGEELCFTVLVNDGGFCCTTEICVTIPDCAPAALPSDLDGDGIVGMVDFLALIAAWGTCSDCGTCPADFDGDCSVGILDLLILLGNWG